MKQYKSYLLFVIVTFRIIIIVKRKGKDYYIEDITSRVINNTKK